MSNTEILTEICENLRRTADLLEEFISRDKTAVNSDEAESSVFSSGNLTHTPAKKDEAGGSVGVIVVKDGKILAGKRDNDFGKGLICGPGGHIEYGETPEQAAIRETQEEFGITPKELISIGRGPVEADTKMSPYIFLCTEYDGEIKCKDGEICEPRFFSHEEIDNAVDTLFKPFADSVLLLFSILIVDEINSDGGPGSGNFGHEGVPGQIGGSAPSGEKLSSELKKIWDSEDDGEVKRGIRKVLDSMAVGQKFEFNGLNTTKIDNDKFETELPFGEGKEVITIDNEVESLSDMCFDECYNEPPKIYDVSSEQIAEKMIKNGDIKPSETSAKTVISSIKSQSDLDSLSTEEKHRLVDEICAENPNWELEHNGSLANEVAAKLDLNNPPTMLDGKEFERYVSENNCVKIWRGVTDYLDESDGTLIMGVDDIKDEFINGTSQTAVYGGGNYGFGYHFSTDKNIAEGFGRSTEDEKGTVFHCAIKNNAKIVDFETAKSEAKKFGIIEDDFSAWALINGYDAIASENGTVYNILNRDALVMKKV